TGPGKLTWTWVQTHMPDWYMALAASEVTERGGGGEGEKNPIRQTSVISPTPSPPPSPSSFDLPLGPQPEQLRLLTYISIAAGCRGLGFWSDRFLANSHYGRDRL